MSGQPTNYNLTYNGYYYTGDVGENPDYLSLLEISINSSHDTSAPFDNTELSIQSDVSGSVHGKEGDYLLLNNTTNLSLYKYTNLSGTDNESRFKEITLPNYFIFYSVNSNYFLPNHILFCDKNNVQVTILNYNSGTFDSSNIFNTLFEGIGDKLENKPEAVSDDLYKFFIDTDGNDDLLLYQCYEISENNYEYITCITGLSKFSFKTTNVSPYNDRYVTYIELKELRATIIKINFMTEEYTGYQGFYTETTNYVLGMEKDIINKIRELKLGRDVILNDTLLTKYNNGVNLIYIVKNVSEENEKVIIYNFQGTNLYNDLLNLNILNISRNNINIQIGYFDQNKTKFVGNVSPENQDNNEYYLGYGTGSNSYDLYYNINYELGYGFDFKIIFTNLYKFNFNDDFLGYVYMINYNYHYNIQIIKNIKSDIFYGYYNIGNININIPTTIDEYLTILPKNVINGINRYSNVGNILLSKTQEGKTYTSTVNITNNNLVMVSKLLKENESFCFFYYYDYEYNNANIKSVLATNNSIEDVDMNKFPYTNTNFIGIIGNGPPSEDIEGNDGDLYLNYIMNSNGDIPIYQYTDGSWHTLRTNIDEYDFTDGYNKFHIEYNGYIYNIENTTQEPMNYNLTYNGYYSTSDVTNNDDKTQILNNIKGSANFGDYLLLNNSNGISINKYYGGSNWIEIFKPDQFLFYSVDGYSTPNTILYINNDVVTYTTAEFPSDKTFEGLIGLFNNLPLPSIDNLNKYYLSTDNIDNLLSICYEIETDNYLYIPVFACLSKLYYIVDNSPYNDKYIVYIDNSNNIVNLKKIIFNTKEKVGFQGFYTESTSTENNLSSDITNKIEFLKFGRPVINGDTLLTQYNGGKYKIYVITGDDNTQISEYELDNDYVLFYDLLTLNILKINNDGLDVTNNGIYDGYFDQIPSLYDDSSIYIGYNEPNDFNSVYYFQLGEYIYINVNNMWIKIFTSVYQINNIFTLGSYMNIYTNYLNLKNYFIGIYLKINTSPLGYYSNIYLNNISNFKILEILTNIKKQVIATYDNLLINVNN